MADTQTIRINRSGGTPEIEIQFGDANIGVCRLYRWDSNQQSVRIGGAPGKVSLGLPAVELGGKTVGYEALIQSSETGSQLPYSMLLLVRQDGEIVPDGSIWEHGVLNGDGAKSVIGFLAFQLS
jgi:hypothetical protein